MQKASAKPGDHRILSGIQMLRGLAAFAVVVAHANLLMGVPESFGSSPFAISQAGMFGVAVFFTISGFIIVIVSLDSDWRPRIAIPEYAWRRFVRIVPFLWLSVLGYNALSYVGTGQVEWLDMLRALTLWPIGELKPNVVWSLQHEFLFYMLFAVAMLGPRRRWWILLLWFAAPLIYLLATMLLGVPLLPGNFSVANLVQVIILGGFSGANVQFGVGFALGLLWLRYQAFARMKLPFGLLGCFTAMLVATVAIELLAFPDFGWQRMVFWSMLSMGIVATGIATRGSDGIILSGVTMLGNASFSIYLTHNGVLMIMLAAARRMSGIMPPTAWLIVMVIVATVGGIIVHLLVEKPLIRWVGKRTSRVAVQRPAA